MRCFQLSRTRQPVLPDVHHLTTLSESLAHSALNSYCVASATQGVGNSSDRYHTDAAWGTFTRAPCQRQRQSGAEAAAPPAAAAHRAGDPVRLLLVSATDG